MAQARKPMEIGERHGRLTVIDNIGVEHGHSLGRFQCDCGEVVMRRLANVRIGNTISCGCLRREGNARKRRQK